MFTHAPPSAAVRQWESKCRLAANGAEVGTQRRWHCGSDIHLFRYQCMVPRAAKSPLSSSRAEHLTALPSTHYGTHGAGANRVL